MATPRPAGDPSTSNGISFQSTLPPTPSFRHRGRRGAEDGLASDSEHAHASSSAISGKSKIDDPLDSQKPEAPAGRLKTLSQAILATLRLKQSQGANPSKFKVGPHELQQIMQERQLPEGVDLNTMLESLHTNRYNGLDDYDALSLEERKAKFGSNTLPTKPVKGLLGIILKELLKTTSIALMVTAFTSLGVQIKADGLVKGWYYGVSLLIALGVDVLAKACSDYIKSRLLQRIKEEKKKNLVEVIRGGLPEKFLVFDIVVGDIVTISDGDQVPADGILVYGQSTVDESWMTGAGRRALDQHVDHDVVFKHKTDPFLFSGSKVLGGYGAILVLAVGEYTEWGHRVMSTLSSTGVSGEVKPRHGQVSSFPRSDAHGQDSLPQNSNSTTSEVRGKDLPRQAPTSTASMSELSGEAMTRAHQGPSPTPTEVHEGHTDRHAGGQIPVLASPSAEVNGKASSQQPQLNSWAGFKLRAKARVCGESLPLSHHGGIHGRGTPLQGRLQELSNVLLWFGAAVDTIVFIALIVWYFTGDFKQDKSKWRIIDEVLYIVAFAISSALLTASEVLPATVTLIVAHSLRKMRIENLMIRKVEAFEMIGAVTIICTDKTGTLTSNQMTVVGSLMDGGGVYDRVDLQEISESFKATLFSCICHNSCGRVFGPEINGKRLISGVPTESAVLRWGVQMGMNYDDIRRTTSTIHFKPFDSAKRRAEVVVQRADGSLEAHWKGAPEVILGKCSKWLDENGDVHLMTEDMALKLKNNTDGMSAKGWRCIAFAYRPFMDTDPNIPDTEEERQEWNFPFHEDLTFLCVLAIDNPFTSLTDVSKAVKKCRDAQIKVLMVTGDSRLIANKIATDCHILTSENNSAEGRDLDRNMDGVSSTLDVLAMSSPSDKLRLVEELTEKQKVVGVKKLKEKGKVVAKIELKQKAEFVAVTGRETKDTRALGKADLGLAMGALGTEVAKQSSGIVILDSDFTDNFTSIVKAIPWGRSVYANIQKFVQFQLTLNFTALALNLVPSVSTGNAPLGVVQLIWVDVIMDTFGALAFATEGPTDDLMNAAPMDKFGPLITNITWRNVFVQAMYQSAVLLTINYKGSKIFHLPNGDDGTSRKDTIVFNAFVMCQIFNMVNAKQPQKKNIFEGLFRNPIFLVIISIEVFIQFVLIELLGEFVPGFAATKPLTWQQWLLCVAIGATGWPLAFLTKFVPVPKKPFVNPSKLKQKWRSISRRLLPWRKRDNSKGKVPNDGSESMAKQKSERESEGLTAAQRNTLVQNPQSDNGSEDETDQQTDNMNDTDKMRETNNVDDMDEMDGVDDMDEMDGVDDMDETGV